MIIPGTGLSIYRHVCDGRISIVNEGLKKVNRITRLIILSLTLLVDSDENAEMSKE